MDPRGSNGVMMFKNREFTRIEFWRELAPQMSVQSPVIADDTIKLSRKTLDSLSASMGKDGFLQLAPVLDMVEIALVRGAILALQKAGLPPVFIYMFDQPWALFHRLRPLVSHFLGVNYALLPNFWAWHIPTVEKSSGWPIHCDCNGQTRFENPTLGQTLMSLSVWIALTDATLDNGCMYVLPRTNERFYPAPIDTSTGIDSAHRLALPVAAGSVLAWTQDLYHWSGQVTARAECPRISLSLEFQNPAFEPLAHPLLDLSAPPAFLNRLSLVLRQFEKYKHMETALPVREGRLPGRR